MKILWIPFTIILAASDIPNNSPEKPKLWNMNDKFWDDNVFVFDIGLHFFVVVFLFRLTTNISDK